MENKRDTRVLYAGWVWILSGFSLMVYGVLGLLHVKVLGVEDAVAIFSSVDTMYLYGGAFLAIFIEGLYFLGSFFPGTTLVVIIAVLSQLGGMGVFFFTIVAIFVGWCLAGMVNIIVAYFCHRTLLRVASDPEYEVKDRFWTTWFPIFRANYEVQQIAEGANPLRVFFSSVRVKLCASGVAALYTFTIPFFIDIHSLSNEEGFLSLGVVALITLAVGVVKLRAYEHA